MAYKHLEDRFDDLDDSVKEKFLSEVRKERIDPTDRKNWSKFPVNYERGRPLSYKYAWSDEIVKFFKEKGAPLEIINSQYLYNKLNRKVIKRIVYGMISTPDIPVEILRKLEDWEKICIYAGAWVKRDSSDVEYNHLSEIVGAYVKAGINKLEKVHVLNYDSKRQLKIPGSQNYHKANYVQERLFSDDSSINDIENLLTEEAKNQNYNLQERIAIKLDSLDKNQLSYLSKKYGKDRLGDYYISPEKPVQIKNSINKLMNDILRNSTSDK